MDRPSSKKRIGIIQNIKQKNNYFKGIKTSFEEKRHCFVM